MPKKKSPVKKQRPPRSAATPACPCCLCGWVYVVNDGSGQPQVRRSCPAGVKVTQVQPGEYVVTFPTIKKVLAPVATLNNSVGTITAVPGLLLADKFTDHERRGAGWALVAVGASSTVPIAMNLLG